MPLASLHNEKDLLRELIAGDAEAFRKVYEFYQGRVFLFAYRFTKSKDRAEETVQEVFIKLWEKRTLVDTEKNFNGWILEVTKNHLLTGLKKAARDRTLQEKLLQKMEALRNSSADELIAKELERLHTQAVELLTPGQKLIFQLSREEELTYEQIAERLGISKNTVRNQMTSALRTIREYLAEHPDIGILVLAFILSPEVSW